MEEKRFALLIDSDNISVSYIDNILDELSQYGVVSYKRIYGDWNSTNNKKWVGVLSDYALQPMQQFAYVKGKNATDSLMIIDAMDILYSDTVDGFCLVTSDSDFTRLAARLRESGKKVIGMGEGKTPQAFARACDVFVNLENLKSDTETKKPEKSSKSSKKNKNDTSVKGTKETEGEVTIQSKDEIEKWIQSVLTNIDGKRLDIGEIGQRLRRRYPDFDFRNYVCRGKKCSNLSSFLETMDSFFLQRMDNHLEIASATVGKQNLKKVMIQILTKNPGIEMSLFGIKIKEKVPGFHVKDYNCSQFKKFLSSLTFLEITMGEDGRNYVVNLK